jgi:hypothetical protein
MASTVQPDDKLAKPNAVHMIQNFMAVIPNSKVNSDPLQTGQRIKKPRRG